MCDVRWGFLTAEEQAVLERYDTTMVQLLSKRPLVGIDVELEAQILMLHSDIDLFIICLEEKYCR